nr:putative SWI/SNF-related matrix-associated actin-dependent regulator of chromatin subfamily A member 3-like 3 [Tanacetum cinerariifolium]
MVESCGKGASYNENSSYLSKADRLFHKFKQKPLAFSCFDILVYVLELNDTVEERMQQVQARKQRMIAEALTDKEVRLARLKELKMLLR